mmetsp:Transcript_123643/g.344177  ORF Transcript_123643/g.344177 Transcript_123643/m.344177 type:complete len:272 (+) Transcript_123643:69-884(+)
MTTPSDTVFVSDLPGAVDQAKLEYIFSGYGHVASAKILPGAGKNAALVRFQTQPEAKWAVENLHGNIPQGLTIPIQVKYADNPPGGKGGKGEGSWTPNGKNGHNRYSPYGKGGAGDGPPIGTRVKGQAKGGGGVSIQQLKKGLQLADALPGGKWSNDVGALWVGGLPDDTTDLDMYHIFAPFGCIPADGVRAMLNQDGSCKGYGFVNYIDPSAAQNVIDTLNGTQMPDGSLLEVREKAPPRKGGEDGGKDGGKDCKGGYKGSHFGKGGGRW